MDWYTEIVHVLEQWDHDRALHIYLQLGSNSFLKLTLQAQGDTEHNRDRLRRELLSILKTIEAPVPKPSLSQRSTLNAQLQTEWLPDDIYALQKLKGKNYSRICYLHQKLLYMPTATDRAAALAEILQLDKANDDLFLKMIYWKKYGRLPETLPDEMAHITDRAELQKMLLQYEKYVRDARNGKSKRNPAHIPDWENKINDLKIRLTHDQAIEVSPLGE